MTNTEALRRTFRGMDTLTLENAYNAIHGSAPVDSLARTVLPTLREELGRRYRQTATGDTMRLVREILARCEAADWAPAEPTERARLDELLGVIIDRHRLHEKSATLAGKVSARSHALVENRRAYVRELLAPWFDAREEGHH